MFYLSTFYQGDQGDDGEFGPSGKSGAKGKIGVPGLPGDQGSFGPKVRKCSSLTPSTHASVFFLFLFREASYRPAHCMFPVRPKYNIQKRYTDVFF